MNIESAKYVQNGGIIAVIDGKSVGIPNDPENRHRMALAEWEAAGNVIAPYEPPPAQETN